MSAQRHVIKKYANRKLYDTQNSRYITLEGISKLVRDGHDIQVVERDTGRDLTSLILSQIVMGEEKRVDSNGVENLHDRGQALLGYVRRTLSGSAALVSGEVERRRSDLEDLVDSAVVRALAGLSIPSRRDFEALSARVDQLEQRLHTLSTSSRTRTAAGRR
jgi:PHB/PHA accumulation regulator DNA-binding domain/Poly(hydroxyalcanoate) granule associated protein (phasin)